MRAIRQFLILLATLISATSSPLHAAPPLEAYGKQPAVEQIAISESGRYLATVLTINGLKSLIVSEGKTKILRQVKLADVKVRDLSWAGDDHILLTTSKTEKMGYGFTTDRGEFYQTLNILRTGNQQDWIFFKERSIGNTVLGQYGARKVNGRWQGFFGGYGLKKTSVDASYVFEDNDEILYRVDLAEMSTKKVDREGVGEHASSDWLIDEQGNIAAKLDFEGARGKWKLRNGQDEIIAEGEQPQGGIALIALGDGSVFFSKAVGPDEALEIFEVPLAGGEAVQRFQSELIDRYFIDRRTSKLLGYVRDDEDENMIFFDPMLTRRAAAIKRAFAKYNVRLEDWSSDFSKVLVTTNGNQDSGNWWLVDLDNMRAETLGYSYPAILPEHVGNISTFSYKAADGLDLDGILTLPPNSNGKNLPAIMMPHGGPHSQSRPIFDWWAQAFASRGYAVLQPNFRGSTNKDAAFIKAGDGEWGRKMQSDISDGLSALAAKGIIDPQRVCIMGASYGGYAALAGVTLQQDIYRCAVSVAGVADLGRMVREDIKASGGNKTLTRILQADIGRGQELNAVSPIKFAAQADAPILLIHGKDDTVVDYNQSTSMADALKDAGKPYQFITLEGEDHWLSNSATRLKMLQSSMDFILTHNPPDSAAAK